MSLDAVIDSLLSPIADKVSGIIFSYVTINGVKVEFLIALLIFAAIYFTIRTGFIGIWGFKHAIKLITNNYEHNKPSGYQRKKKGELPPEVAVIPGPALVIGILLAGGLIWRLM